MQNPKERRRAKAMSAPERRSAIVAATLPLVEEHGAAVTTKQIAQAAGIAEGTVFRAFKDKTELLVECMRTVVLADTELKRIQAVDVNASLEAKLHVVAYVLDGYLSRVWRYAMVLREIGFRPERDAEDERKSEHSPQKQSLYLRQAVEKIFAEDQTPLSVDASTAANLFQGLIFSDRMLHTKENPETLSHQQIIHVFLHGANDQPKTRKKK